MRILRSMRWLFLAALLCLIPASSYAGVFISVGFAPPVLPVYVQPECPEPGYIWTPGYWAYGDDGYYWVPGAWVPAPYEGALWTPPYWGWDNSVYVFHPGYWGHHVGYYGGLNYGFGYFGIGFVGGEWHGREFAYNTAVVNVNRTVIRNVYVNKTVINNVTVVRDSHVAYAGGPGGVRHDPTPQERSFMHESHTAPTSFQQQHIQAARMDHANYFKANNGHPQTVAVARPLTAPRQPAAVNGGRGNLPAGTAQPGRPAPLARPENRPTYQQPSRQGVENRPAAQPQSRPTPEYRPAPQQQTRPTPEYRPAPQARPAPQPQAHPAPEYRPAPQSRPAPQPQYRPAPQPQYRPAPQSRPEPQYRPAPQARPEPQAHPAPQPRQESRPEPRSREPHR